MLPPTYIVKPHPKGGSRLAGPRLPYALWYEDERAAADFAAWHLRETGGRIVFYDSHGTHIITENVPQAAVYQRGDASAGG